MNIALIASEVAPFAKTGGLADVAGALPKYLAESGAEVRVFMPLYRTIRNRSREFDLKPGAPPVVMDWAGGRREFSVWVARRDKVTIHFIDTPDFFDRDGLYGTPAGDYPDNGDRFAFFSRACLEAMKALYFRPDIIQAHDWQSALVLAYKKFIYGDDPFFEKTRSLFTIHNLGYQGLFEPGVLERAGLPGSLFDMEALEFFGKVNFLKAGILYSEAVNTVSVRYSQEIQTEEYGCGLDGLLRSRKSDLFGVLNGVDYAAWNPETDKSLAARYGSRDLRGKTMCRQDLLRIFGLSAKGKPVVGLVSRLAGQKGLDILVRSLDGLFRAGAVLVILGQGEPEIEKALTEAADAHPGELGLKLGFDETLARKIYAGSDFFLIPSRYEPCGLTQMYALKYGTIPVVRATGGLDDTIQEFNLAGRSGNGFKFEEYSSEALLRAVERAAAVKSDAGLWRSLRTNAMACDFSWTNSARKYLELFERIRG